MGITVGDRDHAFQIVSVWYVPGDMEAEVTIHHDGRLHLTPVCIGIGEKLIEVFLVRLANGWTQTFQLVGVAFLLAVALPAGNDGRKRHAGNGAHLAVALTDADTWQTKTSLLKAKSAASLPRFS